MGKSYDEVIGTVVAEVQAAQTEGASEAATTEGTLTGRFENLSAMEREAARVTMGLPPGANTLEEKADSLPPETGGEETREGCDGDCALCGGHHEGQLNESELSGDPHISKLAASLRSILGGQPKPSYEERVQLKSADLLRELQNSALLQLKTMMKLVNDSLETIKRVLSIVPADLRENLVGQLEVWVKAARDSCPAQRAEDIANGRETTIPKPVE